MAFGRILFHPGNPGGGPPSRPPRLPELRGAIGHYRRHELIGEGGMGQVFRGTDENGKSVILKFISLHQFINRLETVAFISFLLRFLNEYELGSMLRHPNVARVIDTNIRIALPGVDNLKNIFRKNPSTGEYTAPPHIRTYALNSFEPARVARKDIFIATEFVPDKPGSTTPAPTIAQCFKGQPINTTVVKMFLLPVFEALAVAHQNKVAHRDLKPDNLLVTEEKGRPLVKLIDLGIARETVKDHKTVLTTLGHMLGTPLYMPPADYTHAAQLDPEVFKIFDIYSMGAVIYELMLGKDPFEGMDLLKVLAAKTRLSNFDFTTIEPKARAILRKMMSPRWQNNFSSMPEVIKAWRNA